MKKFIFVLLIISPPAVFFGQINDIFIKSPYNTAGNMLFDTPYDSAAGNWSRIAPLQGSYFGSASYYWNDNGKVFICGGIDSLGNISGNCAFYNPQTNSYESKAPLLTPRYLGKLVKVRDSLYLVGSVGANFFIPDGALYKYDLHNNSWTERAPVTGPALHEMAVCVWRDSLILAIGGSSNAFGGAVNLVHVYSPWTNSWRVLTGTSNPFPVNITAAQAECIGNDIVVVGGYNNSGTYNEVHRGYIYSAFLDSLSWRTDSVITTPFQTGVYRTAGSQYGNSMVFGPALSGTACINQVWAFSIIDSVWTKFTPNSIDTASRTSIAVRITSDSMFFYLFGGIIRDSAYHFINKSEKFSTINPLIGISVNQNYIPQEFKLEQNYPNPFNPKSNIKFQIAKLSKVRLVIFDILGSEITVLVDMQLPPGTYEVNWDGSNYPSGVYFYRLITGGYAETKKMVLLK